MYEYSENYDSACLYGLSQRKADCPPISIDADETEVVHAALNQNFVPIVDSRNTLCGILTRRGVIAHLAEKNGIHSVV